MRETRCVDWFISPLVHRFISEATRIKGYYCYWHSIVTLKNYSTIYTSLKQHSELTPYRIFGKMLGGSKCIQ